MKSEVIHEKLLWSKYRPKKINGVIMLPRVSDILLDAETKDIKLDRNLLLYSTSPGTGKTTIAKIIAEKYETMSINASFYSSVDNLREVVNEFCLSMSSVFSPSPGLKVVFLDEFDGVSSKYQEALRGFIEDNEERVRFVATCNDVSKISDAMKSRFTLINFNPTTQDETKYLKNEYAKRISLVAKKEQIEILDTDIIKLVDRSFPDLRKALDNLQVFSQVKGGTLNDTNSTELYKFVMSGSTDTFKTYEYIINNWSEDVGLMFELLGTPFIGKLLEMPDKVQLGTVKNVTNLVYSYAASLPTDPDPVLSAISLVFQLQELFKK